MTSTAPVRGEVWDLDFDPTIGHEQAGFRPALVISMDIFNESRAELVVVAPITRTNRDIHWHVAISPPEGGLTAQSFIQCENLRSLSKQRLRRLRGRIAGSTLQQVEDRLRILLNL